MGDVQRRLKPSSFREDMDLLVLRLGALTSFPAFRPAPPLAPSAHRPTTKLRFSRWNNANADADSFLRQQQQIEQELRRHRLYDVAARLADVAPASDPPAPGFRSHGTPSAPSAPSIPGKKSKYSRTPEGRATGNPKSSDISHPAFRPVKRFRRSLVRAESAVRVGEHGISYRLENAPFEFQYSYTETPKVKPLGLREQPYLPFGPSTVPRPWTGRAPLPPSKKKLPEFDSFKLPPPGKKGVKPVQNPGPFLAGSGPKYHAKSREEVLGEDLTEEEVKDLVQGCMKTTRQLNIGRDGLTHNMLDNIHAHWKRRRVCKIKCKGVCTVDMDNVRRQLEEKTGGKVIYSRGGVIFLFRGRNYNYKTRPKFPLMLWKPSPPIYPKLVPRVPEGLTLEEVTEMRKKGRQLLPICKLAKNGVYVNLVNDVKEAFEECELVCVNCKGLNKSDCHKIGAKLKDLVPCMLISFEFEHILMWRGKDWSSYLKPPEPSGHLLSLDSIDASDDDHQSSVESYEKLSISRNTSLKATDENPILEENIKETEEESDNEIKHQLVGASYSTPNYADINNGNFNNGAHGDVAEFECEVNLTDTACPEVPIEGDSLINGNGSNIQAESVVAGSCKPGFDMFPATLRGEQRNDLSEGIPPKENFQCQNDMLQKPYLDKVMLLLKQATESGSAVILKETALDADIVYERAVTLAKTAPSGPIFKHHIKKKTKKKVAEVYNEENGCQDVKVESLESSEMVSSDKRRQKNRSKDNFEDGLPAVVPHGNLKVDELAKLLA